jgi:hypothetical protein
MKTLSTLGVLAGGFSLSVGTVFSMLVPSIRKGGDNHV